MLTLTQKTVYELDYQTVSKLFSEHFPNLNDWDVLCMQIDGNKYHLVDVGDDIVEPEEWRKGLLSTYRPFSAKESLREYLSLLCYDKILPAGDYLVSLHW